MVSVACGYGPDSADEAALRAHLRCDREPRRTPFGEPFDQSSGTPASLPQQFDGTVGIDAVGSAAIRHVFLVGWQRLKTVLQLVDRNRDGTGNMAGVVLVRGPSIENNHVSRAGAFEQIPHPDRVWLGSVAEVLLHEAFEIRQPSFGHIANRGTQLEHCGIGEPVVARTVHPCGCRPGRPAVTTGGVARCLPARARSPWPASQPCARSERAVPASRCGGGCRPPFRCARTERTGSP